MGFMNFTKTVITNLFHKPVTTAYPFEPEAYPERTRGKVGIAIEQCIFCGMCGRKCQTGAIRVDRAEKRWTIERFGCIQCGSCVENCPKKCLFMMQNYPQPAADKYEESFVQPPAPATEEAPKKEETKGKVD